MVLKCQPVRMFLASAAVSLAVLAAGCGSSGSASEPGTSAIESTSGESAQPSTSPPAAQGGELVFLFPTAPLDLDPSTGQDNNVSMPMWNAWFEYLIKPNPDGDGYVPMLADEWTVSDDELTYTFHIRPNVKFSNGQPLRAADVVYSLTRTMQPDISLLHSLSERLADLSASADTVTITLKEPWPYLLAKLASPTGAIYPDGSAGSDKNDAKKFFSSAPIGTGPFVLSSTVPNSSYVVTRNLSYWDTQNPPKLDQITFDIVTDDTARATAVRGGRADIAVSPPANLLAELENDPSVNVVSAPSARVELLALNTRKPPLDNEKVRQAISYAINRDAIIESGLFGFAEPTATFLVSPPEDTYQNTSLDLYPFDVERAKQLMQESGVSTPITLPFEVSTGLAQDAILNIVQDNLGDIGINVKVTRKDEASVDNDIITGNYMMNTTFWGNLSADPSDQPLFAIDPAYCCDAYFTGYDDPALVQLVHEAISTSDRSQAQAMFDEIQKKVADAAHIIPLYYPELIYLTSERVVGFEVNPYGLYDWISLGFAN